VLAPENQFRKPVYTVNNVVVFLLKIMQTLSTRQ